MTGRRGRPFEPGNKFGRGRPRGSRNKTTLATQELLREHSQPLLHKALVMALKGDSTILRLLLDRILPRTKDPAVRMSQLRTGTPQELLQTHETLMRDLASGQLTPTQAQQIDSIIESRRRLLETEDLERRVRAIEQLYNQDPNKAA